MPPSVTHKPLRTADVFVPGREPVHTYNPRSSFSLEEKLCLAIEDGGSIISLTGPTKTGKTVLLKRSVEDAIWLDGSQLQTVEEFWHLVAGKAGIRIIDSITDSKTQIVGVSGALDLGVATAGGDKDTGYEKQFHTKIVASIPQEVTRYLEETDTPLIIDDFHFINKAVQKKIIQILKPPVFKGLRVVVVSITHHWKDITESVDDMGARVSPIDIPQWTDSELKEIAQTGCRVLNVEIADDTIEHLVKMSFGSPHIMQHLCRQLLRNVNGISNFQDETQIANAPEDWATFFASCTFRDSEKWFNKLRKGPKVKGTARTPRILTSGAKTDIYGLVLEAMAETGPKMILGIDEIMKSVNQICRTNTPKTQEVSRVLTQMSKLAAMRILEAVPDEDDEIWDSLEQEFAGSEPVLDFVNQDDPEATIHIADPFFAYYLRWGTTNEHPIH